MIFSFNPVEKFQAMFNRLLQQDPQAFTAVKALTGKVIAIEITGTGSTWYLQFTDQGFVVDRNFRGQANVTVKARPAILAGLLLNRDGKIAKISPDMEISGDVGLAQEFQQILKNLDIDWEEHLSQWVGDTAAHKLGRVFKHTRNYIRETQQTIGMDISEYLRYEKEILPDRDEVELFNSAVDKIRNDTERLVQRLEKLQARIIQNNS
jgi:ubiquinone biosynthesis accessory factor UbiJ